MKPKFPKKNLEARSELVWLNASLFKPRITRDGKTLMLFLGYGNAVIGLNLAYLDTIRVKSKTKSA